MNLSESLDWKLWDKKEDDISSLIPSLSFMMTLRSSLFSGTNCRADLKSPKASLVIPRDLSALALVHKA